MYSLALTFRVETKQTPVTSGDILKLLIAHSLSNNHDYSAAVITEYCLLSSRVVSIFDNRLNTGTHVSSVLNLFTYMQVSLQWILRANWFSLSFSITVI